MRRKKKGADLDVDEIFIDSFQIRNKDLRWEHRLEFLIPARPVRVFTLIVMAALLVFTGRLLYLNTVRGHELTQGAAANHLKVVWTRSPRGIVYDQHLTPLVGNESAFDLIAVPAELPQEAREQERATEQLLSLTSKSREEILSLFSADKRFSYQPIPLETNISREEIIEIESMPEKIPGVRVEESFKRAYPEGATFAHVLGYTGLVSQEEYTELPNYLLTDLTGRVGVEKQYESTLRGTYGKTVYEVDAHGREERTIGTAEAHSGKNVVLFLDAPLQRKITEVMERTIRSKGLTNGAAVALDPRSGGILALQSFPVYNSNVFSQRLTPDMLSYLFHNESRPLLNRAIGGLYPPGSTIKPFMAAAGLTEGVVNETTTVNVTGPLVVAGEEFEDWRLHGVVDLKRALAVSSNVFFYILGGGFGERDGLGIERIKQYLSKFNLAGKTGIDLPGEVGGILPDPQWKKGRTGENWYIGDTYNTSIGQGFVSVTPLSLAMATAAVANDGILLRPRMVKAVVDSGSKDSEFTEIEIIRKNFIDKDILRTVREGLRESVISGYTRVMQDLPVKVAGKTGSAQNVPGRAEHAWYAVFAPYEDPEIVIVLLIENAGLGSDSVVPAAKEILNWYFTEHRLR